MAIIPKVKFYEELYGRSNKNLDMITVSETQYLKVG